MSYEPAVFTTPEGGEVKGYFADIYFADDGVSGTHTVWIIADPMSDYITDILADESHPDCEKWRDWDTEFFFYCDSDEEFRNIVANGSGDGWFIVSHEISIGK